MHACTHTHTCMHTPHTCAHTQRHMCTHTPCTYTFIHKCMHAYMHRHTHTYTHTHTHTYKQRERERERGREREKNKILQFKVYKKNAQEHESRSLHYIHEKCLCVLPCTCAYVQFQYARIPKKCSQLWPGHDVWCCAA